MNARRIISWSTTFFAAFALSMFLAAIVTAYNYYSAFTADIDRLQNGHPVWRDGKLIAIQKKVPKGWIRASRIDHEVKMAIVISEDWGFFGHNGIDVIQIKEAVWETLIYSERLRGASTITQQVVKNLFLTNERSYVRKFVEIIGALYMDKALSKNQILEIYLNIAQFGDHLYGISDAAHHYFQKSAGELTVREGAFLAMLLPNPVKYSQSYRRRELSRYALNTINSILKKMRSAHILDEENMEEALGSHFEWEDNISEELHFPWSKFKIN